MIAETCSARESDRDEQLPMTCFVWSSATPSATRNRTRNPLQRCELSASDLSDVETLAECTIRIHKPVLNPLLSVSR